MIDYDVLSSIDTATQGKTSATERVQAQRKNRAHDEKLEAFENQKKLVRSYICDHFVMTVAVNRTSRSRKHSVVLLASTILPPHAKELHTPSGKMLFARTELRFVHTGA